MKNWNTGLFLFVLTTIQLPAQIIDLGECKQGKLSEKGFDELKKQIGDARIVILGEQEHGVGTDYENFAFWVKYLHEKMEFNVILQEYCFFHFGEVNSRLTNNPSAQEYRSGMYWPQAKAMENNLLFDYIDQTQTTPSPIQMEGFDPRIFPRKQYYTYLDSLLSHTPYQNKDYSHKKYLSILDRLLKYEYKDTVSTQTEKKYFLNETNHWILNLTKIGKVRAAQLMRNLNAFAKNAWGKEKYPMGHPDRFYIRERQMAKNIIWFADSLYPNDKIIVRMHNGHAAKNYAVLKSYLANKQMKETPNAGSILNDHYGEQCLHIASTYYSGTYCKWDYKEKSIPDVHPNSLENELHKKKFKYAYVSLQMQREAPFYMFFNDFNLWVEDKQLETKYGMLFDGIIFIDKVKLPTEKKQ
jgi:erythromycin esterase